MMGTVYKSKSINGVSTSGFTIIEVMIVLAITGILFISFATTIQGQQSRAKFNQSINTVKSQIDQLITQSQSGYYPPGSFSCVTPGGSNNTEIRNDVANEQGTNEECMLLGKLILFNRGSDPHTYTVYPIAGANNSDNFVASFAASNPEVVDIESVRREVALEYGLTVAWMRSGGVNLGAVAFTPPFSATAGVPSYGSNTTDVIPVPVNFDAPVGQINARIADRAPGEVQICLRSGTTDQSGLITIGGSSGNNAVSLSIRQNVTCA
jgi:prepilin-type N-terminal cleavage/methylation domain-containing protein